MSTQVAPDHELSRAPTPGTVPASLVWPSLAVAVLALGGSIWLSVGMNLKACPLCLYQRTFVMGVVAVLGVGVLAGTRALPCWPSCWCL
jgi:disulfide bond formation protein DsbB